MWARRVRSGKRNSHGIASIRRDTYNTSNGMSIKGGWWTISGEVRKRSGGKCEARIKGIRCNCKASDVHHIIKLSDGGKTVLSNLIHLCVECHERRHNHMFRAKSK
jgi:5-methylcytosine-specific restriction endonuclease McrA